MRHVILGAALAFAFAGSAWAEPVFGTWKTTPDDNGNFGYIEIAACGEKICGTLVKSFDSSGAEIASENIGRQIVWDMSSKGNGAYGGGRIWAPDRDKTYKSRMTLSGDILAVQGCVLVVCRDGGKWQRVK